MATYTYRHPHPAVTVDIVIFRAHELQLEVLLVKRGVAPFKEHWALPGGFVGIDEELEVAARRELAEEAGLQDLYLEQLGAFGEPDRDPRERVISIAYFAISSSAEHIPKAGSDASEVSWVPYPPNATKLAFDHGTILAAAYEQVCHRLRTTTLALSFLPIEFTLSELQQVHEVVLNETVDKRNFQKWVKASEFIAPTGRKRRGGQHRPAELYAAKTQGKPMTLLAPLPGRREKAVPAESKADNDLYNEGFRAGAEQVQKLFNHAYASTLDQPGSS